MISVKSVTVAVVAATSAQVAYADPILATPMLTSVVLPQSETYTNGISAQAAVREAMILLSPPAGAGLPVPVFNDVVDFVPTTVRNAGDFIGFVELFPSGVTSQLGMIADYWWLAAQRSAAFSAAEIAQDAASIKAETDARLATAGTVNGIGLLQQSPYGLGSDLQPFDLILGNGDILSHTDALRTRLANEMSPGFFAQN